MGQLQFRSDDTVQWQEGYGTREDGDRVLTGAQAPANTTFAGTEGTKTGTAGDATGFAIGDIVAIYQGREGGDGVGKWQLNKITNVSGNTLTFKYDLVNDYASLGQIQNVSQNRAITTSAGWSGPAWDGSKGGILFLMGDTATIGHAGSVVGAGYRGGAGSSHSGGSAPQPFKGEGEGAASVQKSSDGDTAANGTTGGGGGGGGDGGSGGGGGGHAAAGDNGLNNQGNPGVGGSASAADNAGGTVMVMGGGGGGGRGESNAGQGTGGNGQRGGGIIVIIARIITITAGGLTANGTKGDDAQSSPSEGGGGGGGGAGGFILLKGQIIDIGSGLVTATGGAKGEGSGGGNGDGGAGAAGRVHIDYQSTLAGTSSPAADTRQDPSLNDISGMLMFL